MLFSYGSGLASSMFSIRITGSTAQIAAQLGVPKRLAARTEVSPQRYNDIMETREKMHNARDCVPVGGCDEGLWQGAVVLDKVDDKFRRIYRVVQ